jgi:hypothetical protein
MKSLLPILFLLSPSLCISQNTESWLSIKFKNADSVLLVSHDDTQGVAIIDSVGNKISLPELIINKKPNYKIIKERQIISGKQLDTLIHILDRPFKSKTVVASKCYMPHHTIFIFKNGELSHIDLCFWCKGFETSDDLNKIYKFDNRKWQELENLFKRLGFKYKITAFD